jgi:hypothetical protein
MLPGGGSPRARAPSGPDGRTVAQIRGWAERHRRRTGRWPRSTSGPVLDAPGETWGAINQALRLGCRGMPRGGSLARLLREHRRGAGRQTAEG